MKYLILFSVVIFSCTLENPNENIDLPQKFDILSLGDSYTIGQGVCDECSYPRQLIDSLSVAHIRDTFNLEVIAQTGWTTNSLINNIDTLELEKKDVVTLLIGVNNQFWGLPFNQYETQFEELINISIDLTKSQTSDDVLVISIPDWAYTPAGQTYNPEFTSEQINLYNEFAENYCLENEISYVYITDITRLGLEQPELVSIDGLHPSEIAYRLFVERIYPVIEQKIYEIE